MPTVPNRTKLQFFDGTITLGSDTVRVALYNNTVSFSPDPDTHEFVSDVLDGGTTAEEFGGSGGTGYSRQSLANQATSQDNTDDEAVFDADDTTFTSLDAETIQGIIIYKQVGGNDTTPGDDPILTIIDDTDTGDLPLTTNGSNVVLQYDAEGILNLT